MAEEQPATQPERRIEVVATTGFAEWLKNANGSIVLSTYQAGKVVFLSWDGQQISMLPRSFDKPLGISALPGRLALATRDNVILFANAPALAPDYSENHPGKYDTLYLPRASYHTADLNIHDVAYGRDALWIVNTRFSCLARLSVDFNFEPAWQPPFITELCPEDRCHLNGLALKDGRPKYVTALGETDTVGGWRTNKATGGVVIDVETNDIILRGLAMPHSPRIYDGALWLLDSGSGRFLCVDLETKNVGIVCELPGYLRGLAFVGPYALIGMCQIRERHLFGGLPIQAKYDKLKCGLAIIDLRNSTQVGTFEFTSGAEELYDVQFLPGVHRPMIVNGDMPEAKQAVAAPNFSYWLRPSNLIAENMP